MLKSHPIGALIKRVHEHATKFCDNVSKMPTPEQIRDDMTTREYVTITASAPKNGWKNRGLLSADIDRDIKFEGVLYVIPNDYEDSVYKTANNFKKAFGNVKNTLFRFIQFSGTFTARMLSPGANNDYEILNPMAFYHDMLRMSRTASEIKIISKEEYYKSNPYDVSSLSLMDISDALLVWLDARRGDIVMTVTKQTNTCSMEYFQVASIGITKFSSRDYANLDAGNTTDLSDEESAEEESDNDD